MKITAFNGSPRGSRSNTGIMVGEFLDGAASAGAVTEQIFLSAKKISNCMGCFKCWVATPGVCVIKDDMTELLGKVMSSDVIILATPLYVDGVSGIMKNFMDRIIPLADPHFEADENGEWRHVKRYEKYPKIFVISNSGMPGLEHFQVLRLHFKRMARNFHSEVLGEIYRDSGELLKDEILMLKPVIKNYKKLLKKAGEEFAINSELSQKMQNRLEKPLIPGKMFIREANKYWDKRLAALES